MCTGFRLVVCVCERVSCRACVLIRLKIQPTTEAAIDWFIHSHTHTLNEIHCLQHSVKHGREEKNMIFKLMFRNNEIWCRMFASRGKCVTLVASAALHKIETFRHSHFFAASCAVSFILLSYMILNAKWKRMVSSEWRWGLCKIMMVERHIKNGRRYTSHMCCVAHTIRVAGADRFSNVDIHQEIKRFS